jgi:hypothetical protein
MKTTLMLEVELFDLCCPRCGVLWAVNRTHWDLARRHDRAIYCPNGHRVSWKTPREVEEELHLQEDLQAARSEIVQLKEQLVRLRSTLETAEAKIDEEKVAGRRRERARRGSSQMSAPPPTQKASIDED